MRAVAIVILLVALLYVLYLWSKRKDQIPCPSCGARVNIYDDKCPHCGHEKGADFEEKTVDQPDTTAADTEDEAAEADESSDAAPEAEEEEAVDKSDNTDKAAADESGDADDEYVCDECGETFDSERGLSIHNGMKH